ncbi:MAG: AbrB/MazE/SpoVT family DNA-binding domain-containing protein [Acidithiobacillus sp.]
MNIARLSSKGQLVLPQGIRKSLDLRTGDELAIILEDGGVRLLPLPKRKLSEVLDRLPGHRPRLAEGQDLLQAEAEIAREMWKKHAD